MDFGKIKDDVTQKAKDLASDEEKSDAVLDKAEGLASKATGGKFDDKIRSVRDAADDRIGDQ